MWYIILDKTHVSLSRSSSNMITSPFNSILDIMVSSTLPSLSGLGASPRILSISLVCPRYIPPRLTYI